MKCSQARRLFGAYWDDESSIAEREWLEAHLASCAPCRREYDEHARMLEWTTSLPRVEPAPDLVERTLARARRASTVGDRVPGATISWIPVTAAAALLLVLGATLSPYVLGIGPRGRVARVAQNQAVTEPVLVKPVVTGSGPTTLAANRASSVPDSLFDHSDDVEFILDPVTLRRGRATVTRTHEAPTAKQAIITF